VQAESACPSEQAGRVVQAWQLEEGVWLLVNQPWLFWQVARLQLGCQQAYEHCLEQLQQACQLELEQLQQACQVELEQLGSPACHVEVEQVAQQACQVEVEQLPQQAWQVEVEQLAQQAWQVEEVGQLAAVALLGPNFEAVLVPCHWGIHG